MKFVYKLQSGEFKEFNCSTGRTDAWEYAKQKFGPGELFWPCAEVPSAWEGGDEPQQEYEADIFARK